MVNIHVLVDTNVLIRASLQETERIELLKMLEFAKKRLIKFTMFEIVLDEFEKHNNKLEETLNKEIAKVSKGIREAISNCKLWNELNDLSNYVINALYNYKGEKYNQATSFVEEIHKLVNTRKIKLISPNAKRFYETQRKITRGELPKVNSNDLHIMDALEEFSKKQKKSILCFVTENKKDFFIMDENGCFVKNTDETFNVKIKNCSNIKGFVTLKQLVSFIEKQGEVNE